MGEVRRLRVKALPIDPIFAHESEQQVADLLDFYEISWDYEPRTFVLETAPTVTPARHLPRTSTYLTTTSTWRSRRSVSRW